MTVRVGEGAQWLRGPAALAEEPSLVSTAHIAVGSHFTPVSGYPIAFSDRHGYQVCTCCTDIHIKKLSCKWKEILKEEMAIRFTLLYILQLC